MRTKSSSNSFQNQKPISRIPYEILLVEAKPPNLLRYGNLNISKIAATGIGFA